MNKDCDSSSGLRIEESVGITIHRVVSKLDAGDILLRELSPLECAPTGDPLEYIKRYRTEVLRPNGVSMLWNAVRLLAAGDVRPRLQDSHQARTYPTPGYCTKRELRRRVAARRRKERHA